MAKQTTMMALCSLLSVFADGPVVAQTTDKASQAGGGWSLTPVDADGSRARAYLASATTGQTYDCHANYDWSNVTISAVVCHPLEVTPRTTSPNSGPYVPSMMPVNGPQTVSLFVWFVNPDTGSFMGCVWNHGNQACKQGEIRPR
jgi:hypothetical protein